MQLIARLGGLLKGTGVAGLLRRLGLTVVPLANATGASSGVRLQWTPDEPGTVRGTIVEASVKDRKMRFFVANERDEIQSRHRYGVFYEQEELDIIARHFSGGVFVDVGANVGNHSLYALAFLDAAKVIAFEPLPAASQMLSINMALNGLEDRLVLYRLGLSDGRGFARPDSDPRKIDNLGATRLAISDEGLELARGDDLLSEKVDFIKIDVEGFELRVLEGLRRTIIDFRPTLFVEVENENLAGFETLMAALGYRIEEKFRRYNQNLNILAVPEERGA